MKKIVKLFITIIIGLIIIDIVYIFNNTESDNTHLIADAGNIVQKEEVINKVNTITTTSSSKTATVKTTKSTAKTTKKVITTTKTTVVSDTKIDGIGKNINGASIEWLNKLNNELNRVPKKLLTIFTKEGWTISVTGENLAKTHFNGKYSSVQGLTNYNEKYILIENRDNAINESTIHEFGHFLDYYLNFASSTEEFRNIYNDEVEKFKSNISNSGCVRNEREFFAETFYYMYTDSSKCTSEAYRFINNLINNL